MANHRYLLMAACFFGFGVLRLGAQDTLLDKVATPNMQTKTLGGTQFWSDVLVFDQWRIQQNAVFGQYRLLDDKNVRRAWGTYNRCEQELERFTEKLDLPPLQGKAVIVLHGLGRTRKAMDKICRFLAEDGEYTVLNVTYASTRKPIDEHAANLARIVDQLDHVAEINFVAHSMGNLVIRHYLGDNTDHNTRKRPDPRIRRIIMLGPPNNGSHLAELFDKNALFRLFCGVSGGELSGGWAKLSPRLATPQCEFAIVAGEGASGTRGNPLLPGDDDFVVSVAETRLAGATDFATLPVMHTFLMDDPTVQEYTLRFLRQGFLISREKQNPILTQNSDNDDNTLSTSTSLIPR